MNAIQHATQPMIQSTQYSLKIVSQFKILSTWISKTHTHTLNKSNQFYISKTKFRQFSEHTLTDVKLVMAKSHCIYTCIKNSKEYYVLCVKNIARLHKCIHVMLIWDMRKLLWLTHNHNCLIGTITFKVHVITPTSPRIHACNHI